MPRPRNYNGLAALGSELWVFLHTGLGLNAFKQESLLLSRRAWVLAAKFRTGFELTRRSEGSQTKISRSPPEAGGTKTSLEIALHCSCSETGFVKTHP